MGDFGGSTAAQSNINQSQAFAAALQRAKQIAAKIQPNPQQGGNNSGGAGGGGGGAGFKRSLDDSDSGPENKRFTSPDANDYGHNSNSNMSGGGGSSSGGGGPANMTQAIAQAAAVAARLAATAGNTCEEQVRIPDCLMSAFYGRGNNETISHIQGDSGCKVQMSQTEGERILTLRGSRESVTKGREVMQQLANRNGGGNVEVVLTINMPPPGPTGYPPYQEIMIPGTKVGLVIGKGGDTIKQLQEKTGAKMVIIQDGPNQEVIKPLRISGDPHKIENAKQLVLELIAQKDAQQQQQQQQQNNNRPNMGGNGGGMGSNNSPNNGGGNYNNFGGGNNGGEQCEVFVPKLAVGVVIGKGGDMIRKIQQECGCKLQFIQGKNDEPGDRRCLIQGSRQQVDDAKRMIDGLIDNVMQRNRNGNGGGGGNGGDNGNSNYGYGYGVNHAQQPAREEITFMVPASKCGIVIGRGGETIKLINQQSGAYCEMDRNAVNPPSEKLFKCKGTSEQVEAARQMIAEKINMELPIINRKSINGGPPNQQGGGGGGGGGAGGYNPNDPNAAAAAYQQQWAAGYGQAGGWGDQAQQQQAAGMGQAAQAAASQSADYSTQWIEYYKSMGMHREAEMIEQQLKAKQASAAPQPQTQAQPAAQQAQSAGQQSQDYSAQWAEYYRSIGKIEEAEAIEKQMKASQSSASTAASSSSSSASAAGASAGGGGGGSAGSGSHNTPSGGISSGGTSSSVAVAGQQTKDYSAQWAEYYRSIGKIEEAEALEKQLKGGQNSSGNAGAAGSSGPGGAPGAPGANAGGPAAPGGGYPQAAAQAGGYPQPGGYGGPGSAGGYGAPGGYPGAPQPPGSGPSQGGGNSQKKGDKH
ncbi:far upstream element-binding protein 2 isoform X2 [Lucilia sericata]|uniref:far upstream element-binding protein 2 isoform X2 n=1 Tax=Lucilia sericata TaxID=13632 RepID=UPI0018A866DD|nr:far upstream element-binding protein 2 isoform X2 [Lucilia sericata]